MTLRIHAEARAEINAAQKYLNQQSPGLGRRFIVDLGETLIAIERRPLSFPRVETAAENEDFRRARLQVFRYQVIFELIEATVFVLAVAHTSREPNYWLGRR